MDSGKNVALFDVTVAEVASRQLHRVKKLSFEFRKVGAKDNVEKYREHIAGLEQQDTQS